ncbi:MAG: hypothetical protein EB056_03980, partial [Verrucomicrobia bacterium]|nr:hypothetical protein [Verrucomicrobiota bacterium]
MKLQPRWKSVSEAWNSFLSFSPGSTEVVAVNEILSAQVKKPAQLLEDRWTGKYRIEWREVSRQADSPSRRQSALRDWQRAELVRLGFFSYATLSTQEESSRRLTALAEFVLEAQMGLVQEKAPEADQTGVAGFTVFALGKLGAGDINFFSDLDLIFLRGAGDDAEASTRLARSLVGEMDARGGDLIYRIDLRLRPEGDRGPLVLTQEALEDYYAAYGEVWERCAWIRARRVAGDQENAYELLQSLQPFIYPKGLTPSALGELFEQKSRAEEELIAEKDKEREIKRGRGGLREVEFPVLGLQLLHGARHPTLQTHDLRRAIRNLKNLGILEEAEAATLIGGYDFWRKLEDLLQMRQIRQTHLLPESGEELSQLARAMELKDSGELEERVGAWRDRVRGVYAAILGGLRPTSVTLPGWPEQIGWQDPVTARAAWDSLAPSGEVHATARTIDNFERLQPLLRQDLAKCVRPDRALAGFANFVGRYGARSLLYESLCVSPKALELLVNFFESSVFLGPKLVAQPELFEEVTRAGLDEERTLSDHRQAWKLPKEPEEALDGVRGYAVAEELRIALRGLLGLQGVEGLQRELTALADACLGWAWEFAGKPKWAWVGLGKAGGGGLSFGSDLDLLVVGEGEESVQRAVRFLTEERASGSLFKVDFRLRPYAEGALAVPVKRYAEYYGKEAQGWEIQTLCRARTIAGAKVLGGQFWPAVEKIWLKTGKSPAFVTELREMRKRIETERVPPGQEARAYKTGRGGLIDVEFAAQAWQMREGYVETHTAKVLQKMAKKLPKEAGLLEEGLRFWSAAEWWMRMDEGRGGA